MFGENLKIAMRYGCATFISFLNVYKVKSWILKIQFLYYHFSIIEIDLKIEKKLSSTKVKDEMNLLSLKYDCLECTIQ